MTYVICIVALLAIYFGAVYLIGRFLSLSNGPRCQACYGACDCEATTIVAADNGLYLWVCNLHSLPYLESDDVYDINMPVRLCR